MFDYYVCGENDSDAPDHHGYCKGLTHNEWTEIWANCQENPSGDNYDKCYNMVTSDTYASAVSGSDAIGCGMRTHTDGTTYNPVSGLWEGDGACCPVAGTSCDRDGGGLQGSSMNYRGYDRWSSNWTSIHETRPAYPNNNEPLDEIGNKPDNSIQALETAEDIPPHSCPDGYREFRCAGDGTSEDNGDMIPGCGTGREWNDNWFRR